MNKKLNVLFLSCFLIATIYQANAQATLSFSILSDSIGYGTPGSPIEVYGVLHDLTNGILQIKAVRLVNDTPVNAGWYNQFCLSECYAPTVDSATDTISPNENKQVYTSWSTGTGLTYDTGKVLLEYYDINNPTYKIKQYFYGVTNSSGTAAGIENIQTSINPISIFPNPFTTSATLSVPSSLLTNNVSSITFNLYNETGTQVQSIPIFASGNLSIERNNLSSGIYFYAVYNNATNGNNIIQRGKLVIY